MSAHLDGIPAAEVRALIRDVLRDVLPAVTGRDAESLAPAGGTMAESTARQHASNGRPAVAGDRPAAPPSGVPVGQPGGQPESQRPAVGQPESQRPAVGQPESQRRAVGQPVATGRQPTVAPQRPAQVPARQLAAGEAGRPRPVRLETDADLRQFALDILRLADNPVRRRDLLTGRLTFTLARRAEDPAAPGDHRIETGAVTERIVQSAAKAGQRIVLGPRAVLTPLARDRALALGVPIEKER
jgi:hypothetical protein